MNSSRVLFIGGGVTSALAASMALERLPHVSVSVWDKARGAGGRMATSRSRDVPNCSVDLGAQYISATAQSYAAHRDVYRQLEDSKVIVPADTSLMQGMRETRQQDGQTRHFTAPDGMSSVVKHLLKQSGAEVQFGRRVAEVTEHNSRWSVRTECGLEDIFDMVVLTLPVPQLLALDGGIKNIINQQPDVKAKLEKVTYSTRFVLGLFYSGTVDLGNESWSCKYISEHPIIRFIAVDNIKRNRPQAPTSILVHSTVQFGLENIEKSHEEMRPVMLEALHQVLPSLPQAAELKSLKWLYSQVHQPYPGRPGSLALGDHQTLILGGDAFTSSNFDGCVDSAKTIVEKLAKSL